MASPADRSPLTDEELAEIEQERAWWMQWWRGVADGRELLDRRACAESRLRGWQP